MSLKQTIHRLWDHVASTIDRHGPLAAGIWVGVMGLTIALTFFGPTLYRSHAEILLHPQWCTVADLNTLIYSRGFQQQFQITMAQHPEPLASQELTEWGWFPLANLRGGHGGEGGHWVHISFVHEDPTTAQGALKGIIHTMDAVAQASGQVALTPIPDTLPLGHHPDSSIKPVAHHGTAEPTDEHTHPAVYSPSKPNVPGDNGGYGHGFLAVADKPHSEGSQEGPPNTSHVPYHGFTLVSAPTLPHPDQPWWPMPWPWMMGLGIFLATGCAVVLPVALELIHPQKLHTDNTPVLWVHPKGNYLPPDEATQLYDTLALAISGNRLQSVAFLHVCDSAENPTYHTSVVARQMAALLSERSIPTLVVDATDHASDDEMARDALKPLGKGENSYIQYQYPGMDHMTLVEAQDKTVLPDPLLPHWIHKGKPQGMTLWNLVLGSEQRMNWDEAVNLADGVVLCLSQSQTLSQEAQTFTIALTADQQRTLCLLLFP